MQNEPPALRTTAEYYYNHRLKNINFTVHDCTKNFTIIHPLGEIIYLTLELCSFLS